MERRVYDRMFASKGSGFNASEEMRVGHIICLSRNMKQSTYRGGAVEEV